MINNDEINKKISLLGEVIEKRRAEIEVAQEDYANQLKRGLGDKIVEDLNQPPKKKNWLEKFIFNIKEFIHRLFNTLRYD